MKHLRPAILAFACMPLAIALCGCNPTPTHKEQLTPEGSLKLYLHTMAMFLSGQREGGKLGDIADCVPKADWDWFMDNYEQMHTDPSGLGLKTAMDPDSAKALAKEECMRVIAGLGANGEFAQIISRKEGPDEAIYILRQEEGYSAGRGGNRYYPVKVVREGRYWKVADFAGGISPADKHPESAKESPKRPGRYLRYDGRYETGLYGGVDLPGDKVDELRAEGIEAEPEPTDTPAPPDTTLADTLITNAGKSWDQRRFGDALNSAQNALKLLQQKLPPDDPKIKLVQGMIESAEGAIKKQREAGTAAPVNK